MGKPDLRGMPLGELLVHLQLLTEVQLHEALRIQEERGVRLGQVLVDRAYISARDLAHALSKQFGIPFAANVEEEGHFQPETARLVDEAFVRKHGVIPLRSNVDTVTVGMVYPGNLYALDDITARARKRIMPMVITQMALDRLVVWAYGMQEERAAPAAEQAAESPLALLATSVDQLGVVRVVGDLLEQGFEQGASDIHFEPMEGGLRVRYRIDGMLTEVATLPPAMNLLVISRLKVMANMDISDRRLPQDGRITQQYRGQQIDLRLATVPTTYGERVTIRVFHQSSFLRRVADLGLPSEGEAVLRSFIGRSHGIVLVTGPTGSGKSTTLAAILSELNRVERNILTIEDPVEYNLPGVTQVQVNPKTGLTFATGLRSFLRHDPDVIMVGEIRDTETAEIAMRAALTGHLVFSTLHTIQGSGAVMRLIDMGVPPYMVAAAITGVVSQRLVRVLCPRCKRVAEGQSAETLLPDLPLRYHSLIYYEASGCNYCDGSGYRGRIGLFELLSVTPRIARLIVDRPEAELIADLARQEGMQSLLVYALDKAAAGVTSLTEIRRVLLSEG